MVNAHGVIGVNISRFFSDKHFHGLFIYQIIFLKELAEQVL